MTSNNLLDKQLHLMLWEHVYLVIPVSNDACFVFCFKSFYPFHCKNGHIIILFSFTFRSVYEILFQNGRAYSNKKLTI